MTDPLRYRIRPAAAADSALIRRTIWKAGLDRTNLDWRNFLVAEAGAGADGESRMIGLCQVRRYWGVREFGSLYVREERRGEGIGAALVRACLAGESPPVHLECIETRASYYEAFGFRRIPLRQAPVGLRLKAALGTLKVWLLARHRMVVMRWDG